MHQRGIAWNSVRSAIALVLSLLLCGGMAFTAAAAAGEWPTKTITLIVPYGAGGTTDQIARTVANHMEKTLGVPVLIENWPGGVGVVGLSRMMGAKADGGTIAMASGSILTVIPFTQKLPFDPLDFTYIGSTHESTQAIFVPGDSTVKTIEDLVARAQQAHGAFSHATSGGFGVNDIAMEMLSQATGGWEYRTLPTDGGAEVAVRLLAGDVDAALNSAAATVEHIRSGGLRPVLIVTERWPLLEEMGVPTAREKFGFATANPAAVVAPPGLPEDLRSRLEEAVELAMQDPAVIERLERTGEIIRFQSGNESRAYVERMGLEHRKVIESLGMLVTN